MEEGGSRNRILLTVAQSIPPPHTDKPRLSYREQQSDLRRRLGRVHELRNAHLLDTLERGVLYPVLSIDWNPGKDAAARLQENGKEDQFGSDLYVLQGMYEEVRRIEPVTGRLDNHLPRSYIVLGFKSLEWSISSVLEKTWRDWTGARSIYMNLHSEFDLVNIIFYHRLVPKCQLELFMYVVVVELAGVTSDNLLRLLDFVQRTRVERMNGYISLYRDMGIVDNDSNYFSGEERVESRLSNPNSRMTGSRDSLLASDSAEEYLTINRDNRKISSDSCDSGHFSQSQTMSRSNQSKWTDPSQLQTSWTGQSKSSWTDTSQSKWSEGGQSRASFPKSHSAYSLERSTLRSDWRITPSPICDWGTSLLSTDSSEGLNLPAPLQATPYTTANTRAESPPIGFTSQVSQLQEALSSLPAIPKRKSKFPGRTKGNWPASSNTSTIVRSHQPYFTTTQEVTTKHHPTIAGTIRSTITIKTKQ